MKAYPYRNDEQAERTAEQVVTMARQYGADRGLAATNGGDPNNWNVRSSWQWFVSSGPLDTWCGGYALVRLVPGNYGAEDVEYLGWLGDADGEQLAQAREGASDAHGNKPLSYASW